MHARRARDAVGVRGRGPPSQALTDAALRRRLPQIAASVHRGASRRKSRHESLPGWSKSTGAVRGVDEGYKNGNARSHDHVGHRPDQPTSPVARPPVPALRPRRPYLPGVQRHLRLRSDRPAGDGRTRRLTVVRERIRTGARGSGGPARPWATATVLVAYRYGEHLTAARTARDGGGCTAQQGTKSLSRQRGRSARAAGQLPGPPSRLGASRGICVSRRFLRDLEVDRLSEVFTRNGPRCQPSLGGLHLRKLARRDFGREGATLLCFVKQLWPCFQVGDRGRGRRSGQGSV